MTCIHDAGIIFLCMRPANERCHYNVTSSFIGWRIHKIIPDDVISADVLKWD